MKEDPLEMILTIAIIILMIISVPVIIWGLASIPAHP